MCSSDLVEVKEHDQYIVKIDGSGRMTLRNRKFLRKITPFVSPKTQANPGQPPVPATTPPTPPPTTPSPLPIPTSPPTMSPTPTEPRRSSREAKMPDRLVMNPKAKSYAEAVMTTVPCSIGNIGHLHHKEPGGEGGITEHARPEHMLAAAYSGHSSRQQLHSTQ